MAVGVLALQGGFQAHVDALTAIGEEVVLVKTLQQLSACDGLVIPGGESTTILTLMNYDADWFPMLKSFAQQHWIFGTCAGMILLAKHVEPNQPSLGLIDINVERNAYGRQIDSKIENLPYTFINGQQADEVVFIRAPQIKYGRTSSVFIIRRSNAVASSTRLGDGGKLSPKAVSIYLYIRIASSVYKRLFKSSFVRI